jgi:hypothetical protein
LGKRKFLKKCEHMFKLIYFQIEKTTLSRKIKANLKKYSARKRYPMSTLIQCSPSAPFTVVELDDL